jgi:hypothetical protein
MTISLRSVMLAATAGFTAIAGASAAQAATDTIDYANNGAGYYFLPPSTLFSDSPYWRDQNQDWGWQHNAMAGGFTTASLYIGAYDVDSPAEIDNIYAFENTLNDWVLLGALTGTDSTYSYSAPFVLGAQFFDDIQSGLKVKVDISASPSSGWLLTLTKSVITTDGDAPPPVGPSDVPEPASWAMMLAGFGLAGTALRRSRRQAAVSFG